MTNLLKESGLVTAGVLAGYYFAYRQYQKKFFTELQKEVDAEREFIEKRMENMYAKKIEKLDEASEALKKYRGTKEALEELGKEEERLLDKVLSPEVEENLLESVQLAGTDYTEIAVGNSPRNLPEVEKPKFGPAVIITFDEYASNEEGYSQYSLTYFAGDKVLSNESDEEVDADVRDAILGKDILLKLNDDALGETTLYVRNTERKVEFDIARRSSSFSTVVGKTG